MDQCVEEKLGIKRPPIGYFSKIHVHESLHPRPGRFLKIKSLFAPLFLFKFIHNFQMCNS